MLYRSVATLMLLASLTASCLAQDSYPCTVHLTDGSVVEGAVFGLAEEDGLRLRTSDGELVVATADIARIDFMAAIRSGTERQRPLRDKATLNDPLPMIWIHELITNLDASLQSMQTRTKRLTDGAQPLEAVELSVELTTGRPEALLMAVAEDSHAFSLRSMKADPPSLVLAFPHTRLEEPAPVPRARPGRLQARIIKFGAPLEILKILPNPRDWLEKRIADAGAFVDPSDAEMLIEGDVAIADGELVLSIHLFPGGYEGGSLSGRAALEDPVSDDDLRAALESAADELIEQLTREF